MGRTATFTENYANDPDEAAAYAAWLNANTQRDSQDAGFWGGVWSGISRVVSQPVTDVYVMIMNPAATWQGFNQGAHDGSVMAVDALTFHRIDSIHEEAMQAIELNGGMYGAAYFAAHVGAAALYAAVILEGAGMAAFYLSEMGGGAPLLALEGFGVSGGALTAEAAAVHAIAAGNVFAGAAAGAVTIEYIVYMAANFERMPGGNNQYHNEQFRRICEEYGLNSRAQQQRVHRQLDRHPMAERTPELIREIIEELFPDIVP